MAYPRTGQIYTTAEIGLLDLDDSPALTVFIDGKRGAIQDAQVSVSLGNVPGIADLKWKYIRTTCEWIPIFHLLEGQEDAVKACLDIEPYIDTFTKMESESGLWITPKAYPRKQSE